MKALSTTHYETTQFFDDFAEKYALMGFNAFEIDFVEDKKIPAKKYTISNVIAHPPVATYYDFPALSASRENERNQALERVNFLISGAKKYDTRYVVLWPGFIEMAEFKNLRQSWHNLEPAEFSKLLDKRSKLVPSFLENLCRSLYTLIKKFDDVFFCIPPARDFCEIPLFPQELLWIFEEFKHSNLKYWHSTSCCHIQCALGLSKPIEWLDMHGKNMGGVHLEDVVEKELLFPPGCGEVNFKGLADYIPTNARCVMRTDARFSSTNIATAYGYLKDIKIIK